jgi:hypothetical protein
MATTRATAARSARIEGVTASAQAVETQAPATSAATTATASPTEPSRTPRPRRRRAAISKWAQPVYPIKAIWDAATAEERDRARELATELLGLWLGQQTKEDLAKRLQVPPIRVWQMSQRAVAGMVAAMLRPPEGRVGPMPRLAPEVRELRARVAALEKELAVSRSLVTLLRSMPGSVRRERPKEANDAVPPRPRRVRAAKPGPSRALGTAPAAAPAGG